MNKKYIKPTIETIMFEVLPLMERWSTPADNSEEGKETPEDSGAKGGMMDEEEDNDGWYTGHGAQIWGDD